MDNIIKTPITVKVYLPNKDCSSMEYTQSELTVTQHFNTFNNGMSFSLRIPTHVFDKIKDTDDKYLTNPPKPEHSYENKKPRFVQNIKNVFLPMLLDELNTICHDAVATHSRNIAETEKYIAIKFTHTHQSRKDEFNFASMGKQTTSLFQFFVVYKAIRKVNSLDRYKYKSNIYGGNLETSLSNTKTREWHWFTPGSVEKYQLIKWTQEREDFLTQVQDRFVRVNQELDSFLGNLDEDKINELMTNSKLLLE